MKKTETKKIYIAIAVIVLVIIALWLAKKLTNTEKKGGTEKEKKEGGNTGGNVSYLYDATFPLELTSPMKKGNNVLKLQKWLNKNGWKVAEDGIFGPETENAMYKCIGYKSMSKELYNLYVESL